LAGGSFDVYRYEESTLPEGDHVIQSQERIAVGDGKLRVEVKPNTVVLCQQASQ